MNNFLFIIFLYYLCDENLLVEEFRQQLLKLSDCPDRPLYNNDNLIELQHGKYERKKSRVNLELAEKIYFYKRENLINKDQWIDAACNALLNRLKFLNKKISEKINEHLNRAIDNCIASCRYHFFAYDEPNYKKISFPSTPCVGNYFHYPNDEFKHPNEIKQLIENNINYQTYVMAHNGWVMNDDPYR
jgi:glycogen debranching enzyme